MKELNPKAAAEALVRHFQNVPRDEFIAQLRRYWPTLTVDGEGVSPAELLATLEHRRPFAIETGAAAASPASHLLEEALPPAASVLLPELDH